MSGAVIQGNVELINCRINRETENSFRITRSYGEGPAVDGNITLRNSQLYIDATYARASGTETPSVQNCVLSLQDSHFTVRGSGSWKDIQFDEDYRWYAGEYAPNVPFYTDGREEPLRVEALTKAAYADIYTGDKVGDATVHDASFTESKTIDGFASWPMSFDVTVQMTGDTLDLQKVDGYKELTVQGENGKPATIYGVELRRVLTGFKFIGEQIGNLEAAGEEARYIFGFEESYGYLSGTHVRDKDAVNASLLIMEAAAYYAQKGMNLGDAIDSLYEEYGYYRNDLCSFTFEGVSGMQTMKNLMERLRAEKPAELAGRKVLSSVDYENDNTGLPKAQVLEYRLEGKAKLIVRPSGTEPKIKVYLSAVGKTREEADSVIETMKQTANELMKA